MANFITSIFKPSELQDKNKFNQAFLSLLGAGFTQYDNKDKTYVEKGYNLNPDIYAVVNQKATEVTRIPYYVKRIKDKDKKAHWDNYRNFQTPLDIQTKVKMKILEVKALEEQELKLPLERPNVLQSWREFFAMFETFMDLTGNAYFYMLSPDGGSSAGEPLQMYILPSHKMEIVLKKNAQFLTLESPIDYYMLRDGEQYIKFPADDVIHVKKPNPNYDQNGSHLYGQSPLKAALEIIQGENEALRLSSKTLANGGSFGFISAKEPLTQDQAEQLKQRIVEMDKSPKRLSNIAGSAKEVVFTRISLTTEELQPFEYLKYYQKIICNVLGWDDKLLNSDEGAKYDNYKIAVQRSITSGISPNLRLLEEAFNSEFLPKFKGYEGAIWMFDENELPEMQTDVAKLVEWLKDVLDRGVINRDEFRAAIGYPEDGSEIMKQYTVTQNTISLEESLMIDDAIREIQA